MGISSALPAPCAGTRGVPGQGNRQIASVLEIDGIDMVSENRPPPRSPVTPRAQIRNIAKQINRVSSFHLLLESFLKKPKDFLKETNFFYHIV